MKQLHTNEGTNTLSNIQRIGGVFFTTRSVFFIAILLGVGATIISYLYGSITAYGDAESHLNIAKRVVDSITPGFAQLGGIWLPLPHIFLMPFVYFDFLWRTGLAGSIVSGTAFVMAGVYIFKLVDLITHSRSASFLAALVFLTNPNVLYMQSTPMTELTLIAFFVLSTYYFARFIQEQTSILYLLLAGFFGFCASLSRYDGWALVLVEAGVLFLIYFPYRLGWVRGLPRILKKGTDSLRTRLARLEGRLILFSTLAFFGIGIWLLWGFLILGDPLYFTHSQFSAKSQQQSWFARGELPAYHHILTAVHYYFVTAAENVGTYLWGLALIGLGLFAFARKEVHPLYIILILLVPFLFNVATLYLGQSIIFIPSLTPASFEWHLFNVRYGVMMVPCVAFAIGYLYYRSHLLLKAVILGILVFQLSLFGTGVLPVLAYEDGVYGLSSAVAKVPDAQNFIDREYDYGNLLVDDYARTISIIRTPVPMKNVIYIGNKPYWDESLKEPEKYARWIVMQKDDILWKAIYDDPGVQARLYKYFNKVYTSEQILIFRRIDGS